MDRHKKKRRAGRQGFGARPKKDGANFAQYAQHEKQIGAAVRSEDFKAAV